jgi:hypothetical protein
LLQLSVRYFRYFSVAGKISTCADDVLFWNHGYPGESFIFSVLYAFDHLSLRQAHLSFSSAHSLQVLTINIDATFGKTSAQ